MAKAVNLVVDKEFISEYDDDEIKTTWLIRTLSGIEFMECTQRGYVNVRKILQLGLTGWRDFPDADGNETEFSIENIERIPPLILQDISFAIQMMSSLEDEERKNS